jgi:2-dehydro-3-deoxygalactonokinase
MGNDTHFISCDWGTSSFRLRLIAVADFSVKAEVKQKDGNAAMDKAFRESGESDRVGYYLSYLEEQLQALKSATDESLDGLPILISGMASSTIGMKELPYKPLPFALDGSDLDLEAVGEIGSGNEVLLISGVCSPDDVMRGEEVQIVGSDIENSAELQLMIHPGTHAKHVDMQNGQVTGFRTYMTGELFALLSEKSILAGSVKKPDGEPDAAGDAAFRDGVLTGHDSNIVHSLFLVRTNRLFEKRSAEANFRYLSGLLIGHELRAIPADFRGNLYLAGDDRLVREYRLALDTLEISSNLRLIVRDGDTITYKGQYAVYSRHLNRA